MKVTELGEFGLIERISELLAQDEVAGHSDQLVVGIGDDAAVWLEDGRALIATTDTLVQGVHFIAEKTSWRDLGWKALAVNVSDIAAMGGEPEMALVTLALPEHTEVEDIEEFYRGLAEAGSATQTVIAGGDIVRSEQLVITVAVTGRAELDAKLPKLLRRNGAKEGDVIAVTGTLGAAAAGLRMLRGDKFEGEASDTLIERHLRPRPRVRAALAAIDADVGCGMDISDGLMQDLGHICKASRLGAAVWADKLPIDDEVRAAFGDDEAVALAATGGEDYELLVTGTQQQIDVFAGASDVPVTVIGEVVIGTEHAPTLLDASGTPVELPSAGWDHLRNS